MKSTAFKFSKFLGLTVFILTLTFCNKDKKKPTDPTPPPVVPTTCNVVKVQSSISTATNWSKNNVYMVEGNIVVSAALTIEAGTIIKLKNSRLEVTGAGKIIAIGTANNHIIFTSYADDSYCGDSNGDENATTAQKGDWTSIYLNGGNANTFTYCDVLYAGKNDGGYYNAVLISIAGTSFNFDHCTFAHTLSNSNSSSAFAFNGTGHMQDNEVSVFTNNTFYDNDRPISINSYYTLNPNNIFHNPNNPGEGNKRNGIFTSHSSNSSNTVSFNITEVPYVMGSHFSGGGSGAQGVVNIGSNVIIKFASSSYGIAKAAGRTVSIGTGAILTSIKDDANGGDTNGDGNASSPAAGDWEGFYDYVTTQYISAPYILYAAN